MITPLVEGYTNRLSYQAGDRVAFYVSTRAKTYDIEIALVGAEREVVWRRDALPGVRHPTATDAYAHGCGWPEAFALQLPTDWKSGYYEVRFLPRDADGPPGEAFFAVRAAQPGRTARILLVLATNTYNAYNDWGGKNTYTGASTASFARPMARGQLSKPEPGWRLATVGAPDESIPYVAWAEQHGLSIWSGYAGWSNWEGPFVEWAERSGYAIDFAVNADLEVRPEILEGYRLVLSVGHDAYWSWGMRDALEAFIARGGNAAFFSGNSVFWQVRFDDDGRAMLAYKVNFRHDPCFGTDEERRISSIWSDSLIERPENHLTGVSMCRGGYARIAGALPRGSGGYTVHRPGHWAFEGTGLRYGDVLGAEAVVVGYACDGCEFTVADGLPTPTHRDGTPEDFEILATSPAALWDKETTPALLMNAENLGEDGLTDVEFAAARLLGAASPENVAKLAHGHAVMGVYTRGGTVFTSGCTDWTYGLTAGDPTVERITRNVLDRLST
jgi:hypothetical protein